MKIKFVFFVCLAFCFTFLFVGCGIDNFIYLSAVTQSLNSPGNDPATSFFKFRTSDTENSTSYFKGYEIYYKIYNSETTRAQDAGEISTYNTNNPTNIINFLGSTKKYTRMTSFARKGDFPLIPRGSANRDVTIRLVDYGDGEANRAALTIDTVGYGTPLRTKNDGIETDSFAFQEIAETDPDVQYLSTGDKDKWLVQAYVLAYGYDNSYKSIYSAAFSLGVIIIPQ